ncbi:MAG: Ig-like domain-containing protein [bacterium]|nr:Ig-like domain-containing protein [bacterium]
MPRPQTDASRGIYLQTSKSVICRWDSVEIEVFAKFASGASENVTDYAELSVGNEEIAYIYYDNGKPFVYGLAEGMTYVKAEYDGFTATLPVDVKACVTDFSVEYEWLCVPVGLQMKLVPFVTWSDGGKEELSPSDVKWTIDRSSVKNAVELTPGYVKALQAFEYATVKASYTDPSGSEWDVYNYINTIQGLADSITVTPNPVTMSIGTEVKLAAEVSYTDGNTLYLAESVDWHSENSSIAYVDSEGILHAEGAGITKIWCTLLNESGYEGEHAVGEGEVTSNIVNVEVNDAVITKLTLSAPSDSLPCGETEVLDLYANFSDGNKIKIENEKAIWRSSAPEIISISSNGRATALQNTGSALITAEYKSLEAELLIECSEKQLESIHIEPEKISLEQGQTQKFTVTAVYSDNSTADVSQDASFTVTDSAVAIVSNASATSGKVTAVGEGRTKLVARYKNMTAESEITVVKPQEITLVNTIIPKNSISGLHPGESVEMKALNVFSDGHVEVAECPENSADTYWFGGSNIGSFKSGVFTAKSDGTASVYFKYKGQYASGSAKINVNSQTAETAVSYSVPNFTADKAATLMTSYAPDNRDESNTEKATISVNASQKPVRDVMPADPEESQANQQVLAEESYHHVPQLTADGYAVLLANQGMTVQPEYYGSTPYTGYTDMSVGATVDVTCPYKDANVRMRKIYVGTGIIAFFEEDDSGNLIGNFTASEAKQMAQTIDRYFAITNPYDSEQKSIRARINETFGTEWKTNPAGGMDGTDKLLVFLQSSASVGGYSVMGYFYGQDEFPKRIFSRSNQGEIIYLNAQRMKGSEAELMSTFAHEYQHCCCFNQKRCHNGEDHYGSNHDEITLLNESWSALAEQFSGANFNDDIPSAAGRIMAFLTSGQYLSLTMEFNDQSSSYITVKEGTEAPCSNAVYGMAKSWANFIKDHLGLSVVKQIATSPNPGWDNVEAATGVALKDLFMDWGRANMSSHRSGAPFSYADFSLGKDKYLLAPAFFAYPAPGPYLWGVSSYISGRKRLDWPWSASDEAVTSIDLLPYSHAYYNYAGNGSDLSIKVTYPHGEGSAVLQLENADGSYIGSF